MSSKAIFSKDYFANPYLLLKGVSVETTPFKGIKVSAGGGLSSLWSHKHIHSHLDDQGTISSIPFSFFEDIKRYFSLSQNQDLIAVHKRLVSLQNQIQIPSSQESQALKSQIHNEKTRGADCLFVHLSSLSASFIKGNQSSANCNTLLKVVNFIRKLLFLQPIEHYHYTPIDLKIFKENAINPALQLTPQEKLETKYLPEIQLNSNLPMPSELTRENMQRLELGLLDYILFEMDGKYFALEYDPTDKQFTLSYDNSKNAPSYNTDEQDVDYTSDVVQVHEKKSDGSHQTHPLQFRIQQTTIRSWFSTVTKYGRGDNRKMAMRANSEYTIPLSFGNLKITARLR